MSTLEDFLHKSPIRPRTKQDIVRELWPSVLDSKTAQSALDWGPYFIYYQDQCAAALHEQGRHVIARTHQHIIEVVRKIEQGRTQSDIRTDLRGWFQTTTQLSDQNKIIDNTIELAARLYFMVNIGSYHSMVTQGTRLPWNDCDPKQIMHDAFKKTFLGPSETKIRLEKDFTAFNLQRIADFRICWTDNFADHLRVVDDDRVVAIFHHASFLHRQRGNTLFPAGLVDETILTLALVFPKHDKQGIKWLRGEHACGKIDGRLKHCNSLRFEDRNIENFQFWGSRLVALKQILDEPRSINLKQRWYDRRDGYAWYTFWIALCVLVLTVVFGTVQSITGIIQAIK
ncbi:hypothetical protein IQ06DRAFT_288493 [Phaeosphaeriaceae sp. SRC1lsM3a]|nr:hypothetical protein IQ06DRAFT_288493 [Stagonospora sp. SRC1lsM3a]